MALLQRRFGPNIAGFNGLLQPIVDGVKAITKEQVVPNNSNKFLFFLSPIFAFSITMGYLAIIPFGTNLVISNINLGLLYIFGLSSLSLYPIVLSGWSSHSIYPLLGSIRTIAQMLSYEISFGLILMPIVLFSGTFNLIEIVNAQHEVYFCFLCPLPLLFFITILAETHRAPFDLPEAEAELVAGYNVEYSGIAFSLFFLAEYGNMIIYSILSVLLFFGGWQPIFCFLNIPDIFWLSFKSFFIYSLFIIVRAVLPRYRFDQVLVLGWKIFLPLSLSFLIFFIWYAKVFNVFLTNNYNPDILQLILI